MTQYRTFAHTPTPTGHDGRPGRTPAAVSRVWRTSPELTVLNEQLQT
ncbi:hypothetical protein ACIO93_10795 [Streptomyces sp. NPDC087903]